MITSDLTAKCRVLCKLMLIINIHCNMTVFTTKVFFFPSTERRNFILLAAICWIVFNLYTSVETIIMENP